MARCMRCNTEVRPRFAFCYACSRKPHTPANTPPAEPEKPRPTYKHPPRQWGDSPNNGPVIVHDQPPEPPDYKRLHAIQRSLTIGHFPRRLLDASETPVDNSPKSE